MLTEYKKEEAEYNDAVKNSEQLKTNLEALLKTKEEQNKKIQELQEVVKFNNETINSLKKIKNLSIFDQIKDDLVKDQISSEITLGKTNEDDSLTNYEVIQSKNQGVKVDEIRKTKFDSNWDPQFPD
ncbi:hypothetical protein ACJMK2_027534, partial [Sinanodonta woodiana]